MKLDRTVTNEQPERRVLPAGVYKFSINNVIKKMSRNNEVMWEIQLKFPEESGTGLVFDYIVEKDTMMWKFNQIFDSVGADFAEDTEDLKNIIGDSGQVRLEVEHSDQYGDRNRVKSYIKLKEPKPVPQLVKEEDLPF